MEDNTNIQPVPPIPPTPRLPVTPQDNGKNLGIAGMVLGIIAISSSFIPCFFWWAIVSAVVSIVLSSVSMGKMRKANLPIGMPLTGLICSVIAIVIVVVWGLLFAKGVSMVNERIEQTGVYDSLSRAMDQLKEITDTLSTH